MSKDGFTPIKTSSHIEGAKYDSFARHLTLKFANGSHYRYYGVSPIDYEDFLAAPSQGAHFHQNIKNNFPSEQVK